MNWAPVDDGKVDGLSRSAQRLLRRPRPRYRGVLHRWATVVSVPTAAILIIGADGFRATIAMIVFCAGATCMLAISAVVHLRDWPADRVELLVRLDHSAIFLMFATSATPVALLALDSPISGWMLGFAWIGALSGIVAEWIPLHPPKGMMNTVYIVFGVSMLVFGPWLLSALTLTHLILLIGGGVAYTVGAVVVGSRRPDPWTDVFGYHEIWHVMVLIAVGAHYGLAGTLSWSTAQTG